MESKDLIHGQYYNLWYGKQNEWIIQFDKIQDKYLYITGIRLNTEHLNINYNWGNILNIGSVRLARYEEIVWLQACLLARKFIPKEGIPVYEIF